MPGMCLPQHSLRVTEANNETDQTTKVLQQRGTVLLARVCQHERELSKFYRVGEKASLMTKNYFILLKN